MKYLILSALLLLVGCHRSCPGKFNGKGAEVTAVGYGEIKVAPDMARFTIETSSIKATMRDASDETQKIIGEVVLACRKTIPDSNDVRTTQITIGKNFEWVNGANVFKGYSASQSVEITLRDLSQMKVLTQAILETPVSAINNLEFDYSKSDSLRSEVNALAMIDAKKTVEKMCLAVNKTCDDLISARTAEASGQSPIMDRSFAGTMAAKSAPSGISINPGLLRFSAAVEATYKSK